MINTGFLSINLTSWFKNERLDLLALDRDGNVVVIEVKRDTSGSKYASYCARLSQQDLLDIYTVYLQKYNKTIDTKDTLLKFSQVHTERKSSKCINRHRFK